MLDRITESLDFQGRALVLRAERQKVLATNMVNADTPRYQAVDMNFSEALRAATGIGERRIGQAGAVGPVRTHGAHLGLGEASLTTAQPALLYRLPAQAATDNNTVDLDLERAQFAENSVRYEATVRFLNGQIRTLTAAISGNSQ